MTTKKKKNNKNKKLNKQEKGLKRQLKKTLKPVKKKLKNSKKLLNVRKQILVVLYTGNQGTIVGNSNSKIYHVPGQAGYHMNSANAVYFNSEQDAINAGYRKAKR